jgi:hypothetical protein
MKPTIYIPSPLARLLLSDAACCLRAHAARSLDRTGPALLLT